MGIKRCLLLPVAVLVTINVSVSLIGAKEITNSTTVNSTIYTQTCTPVSFVITRENSFISVDELKQEI